MLRDRGINVTIYRRSSRTDKAEKLTTKLVKSFEGKTSEERYELIKGLSFKVLDTYETNRADEPSHRAFSR